MQQANADLASLNRVSHRLALVETGPKLSSVLQKLLPRLLQRIGDNHHQQVQLSTNAQSQRSLYDVLTKIHLKLVEMLSHVMKRVRDDPTVKLNAFGILELLIIEQQQQQQLEPEQRQKEEQGLDTNSIGKDSINDNQTTTVTATTTTTTKTMIQARKDVDAFCLNLSLAYLAIAVPRCSSDELQELLPGLCVLMAHYESSLAESASSSITSEDDSSQNYRKTGVQKQWQQISHLLLRTLEGIIIEEEALTKQKGRNVSGQSRAVSSSSPSSGLPSATISAASNKRIKTNGEKYSGVQDDNNDSRDGLLSPLEMTRRIIGSDPVVAGSVFDLILDGLMYETQMGNVPPSGLSTAGWERLKSGHSVNERDWAAEMAPRNRLSSFKTRLLQWVSPSRRFCLFLGSSSTSQVVGRKRGMSRTVALLVAGVGDPIQCVSEEAQMYLKQHWDTRRDDGNGYGDAAVLSRELLGLCVGGINLQSVMAAETDTATEDEIMTLGFHHSSLDFRRRQVADSRSAELLSTAASALDEVDDGSMISTGRLAILACDKMLSKLSQALGLSLLRGKVYISAAELLQSVVVRLGKINTGAGSSANIFGLCARTLTLSSAVLIPTSTSSAQSASMTSEANVAVRDSLYTTISILCRSNFAQEGFFCLMAAGRESSNISTDLLQLLLRCLGNELDKLRQRATATLDALLFACQRFAIENTNTGESAFLVELPPRTSNPWDAVSLRTGEHNIDNDDCKKLSTALGSSILPLMWIAGQATKPRQSRVVASRWASDLLYRVDCVNATHLLCYLSGDLDVTASSIAREGLKLQAESKDVVVIPEFSELLRVLLPSSPDKTRPVFWDFSDKGKTVAIECLLRSYLDDFHGGEESDINLFMDALTTSIKGSAQSGANDDLMDSCSMALSTCLETSDVARRAILSSSLSINMEDLKSLILTATSSQTRRHLADSFLLIMDDVALCGNDWSNNLSTALSFSTVVIQKHPFKPSCEMHGGALLAGTCIQLSRRHPEMLSDDQIWSASNTVLTRLGQGIMDKDDTVGNVVVDSITIAARNVARQSTFGILRSGWFSVLKDLTNAIHKFGNGDRVSGPRASKVVEPAGLVCSIVSASTEQEDIKACSECIDALFRLLGSDAFRKDEEIALSVGESLAVLFQSKARPDLFPTYSLPWPEGMDENFAQNASLPIRVLYTLLRIAKTTTNNHKRRACSAALFAVVASAASPGSNAETLTCLQSHLEELLDCYLFLLADPKGNQLSREACCLGLAACHNLVATTESEKLNERLLRAFGATTVHGTSAMQETPEQAAQRRLREGTEASSGDAPPSTIPGEANVGGAAGVSEASLGAYREMAAAAVASGRPDILYSMLILSVSHPIWSSTKERRDAYGSAALLGGAVDQGELKKALRPYLSRLLPRILRAMHE